MGADDRERSNRRADDRERPNRRADDRERPNNRRWWWIAGAATLGLLALLASMPNQPRGVQPNPITDRRLPGPTNPQSTPIRGGDVRTPENNLNPSPGAPDTQARMNTRVENAASSVDGVRSASAIVVTPTGMTRTGDKMETTALVGVTLEKSLQGAAKSSTLGEVADAVREVPGVDKVSVTADPAMITRIKRVSSSIADGRLPSQYAADLRSLTDKLLSKAR